MKGIQDGQTALRDIPDIDVSGSKDGSRLLVTTTGGFRLSLERSMRKGEQWYWRFADQSIPDSVGDFVLRTKIHHALNPVIA